jgi:hypothetical protein
VSSEQALLEAARRVDGSDNLVARYRLGPDAG